MRIAESRLRRLVRSLIKENLENNLNNKMIEILNELLKNIHKCKSDNVPMIRCSGMINMTTSRMSDEWNKAGGDQTGGPFVVKCAVGREMMRIQDMTYEDTSLMIDDILVELESVHDVIKDCTFDELSGGLYDGNL